MPVPAGHSPDGGNAVLQIPESRRDRGRLARAVTVPGQSRDGVGASAWRTRRPFITPSARAPRDAPSRHPRGGRRGAADRPRHGPPLERCDAPTVGGPRPQAHEHALRGILPTGPGRFWHLSRPGPVLGSAHYKGSGGAGQRPWHIREVHAPTPCVAGRRPGRDAFVVPMDT